MRVNLRKSASWARRAGLALALAVVGGTVLMAAPAEAHSGSRRPVMHRLPYHLDWDRDGIPNWRDRTPRGYRGGFGYRDRDRDGTRNRFDRFPNNSRRGSQDWDRDGVRNPYDRDLDNDGVRNRWDRDQDGDGRRNGRDDFDRNPRRR